MAAVDGLAPRDDPEAGVRNPRFSGLEPFEIGPDTGFVHGRRANERHRHRRASAGWSRRTTSPGAVDVALEQVRGGANLLDVNMDADLLDERPGDDDRSST